MSNKSIEEIFDENYTIPEQMILHKLLNPKNPETWQKFMNYVIERSKEDNEIKR